MAEDKDILEGLLQGDKASFKQFYDRYSGKIFNTALGFVKNEQDAEEIVQDVFVKIYQSAAAFKGDSSLNTWVYRITVNKSLDFLRAKKSKKRFAFLTSIQEPESPDLPDFVHPGVLLEKQEDARFLFKVIDTLPDKQKTAFILSFVEGLPRQEVANVMEMSLKAVESLLQRSKQNLRKKLDKFYPNRRKS